MEPLATLEDLTALGISTANPVLCHSLLESVSAEVRDAAGVAISRVTATITLAGSYEQYLALPVKPVTEVLSVSVDGTPVTGWRMIDGKLWHPQGWSSYAPSLVDVELTFGYTKVPADIVRLVCMLVSAGIEAAKDGFGSSRGLTYESIDDSRIGYAIGDNEVFDVTALPERSRQALKIRFSGGVNVTGGY